MDTILNKEEIVAKIVELNNQDYSRALNHEVEDLKSEYYKRSKEAFDTALNQFIENGGEKTDFEAPHDELLDQFKQVMEAHKLRKEAFNTALEKEWKDNKVQKKALLVELKALTEKDEINKEVFDELAVIQEKWNENKSLKESDSKELWGEYNYLRDVFYSNVKINHELRELDFQKNLDAKKSIIEKVKALATEEDIKKMNDNLQYYHETWREIGPVKREISEDIWQEFSEASKVIHKKRQDHYDALYAKEAVNLEEKVKLCEQIEAIEIEGLDTVKKWMTVTDELLALQESFRKIGFAGKAENQNVWERYRTSCDRFFDKKSNFFSVLKEKEAGIKDKKMAIIEKAEAIQDSTDWANTTKTLINYQKDWKKIGDAGKNTEFKLWKRFRAACDHFFDRKKVHFEERNNEELENLKAKEAIVSKMDAFKLSGDKDADVKVIKEFSSEWSGIGHVPFKQKDKIYKQYKSLLDGFFDKLKLADTERLKTEFESKMDSSSNEGINRERKRLRAQLNELKESLDSLNMNMQMISKSKSADIFRQQVEKNKSKIENDIAKVQEKLDLIKQIENEAKKVETPVVEVNEVSNETESSTEEV